jgi:lipopolysaccharide transport system permease protein
LNTIAERRPSFETTGRHYEVRIRPSKKWFDFDLPALWEFRDLFLLLVRRDFVVKFKQTILGPLWFLIQPLLTTAVFTVVFSRVAGLSTDGAPPILFYLAGTTIWSYVSQTIAVTGSTFVYNEEIFGRVFFPRLIVPLATTCSNLIALAIQLMTLMVFMIFYRVQGTHFESQALLAIPLVPALILQCSLLSLGCGLVLSSASAKYRDVTHVLPFLLQLWMYASPIIYSTSHIPEGLRWIVYLNPVAPILENFKSLLLGTSTSGFQATLCSVLMTLIILFVGMVLFRRTERTFVDSL